MTVQRSAWMVFAILATAIVWMSAEAAMAQGSLGVGGGEQAIKPAGPFASLLLWIQQQQQGFYKSLTEALKLIRSGDGGFAILVGLSFAYGVLHAAGPGHGKAVISSYMLANEVQLRRGIMLSFASAALQAIVAITVIGLLVFVLRGMGIRQGEFSRWLEIASYTGVTLLGLWLLLRKLKSPGKEHAHAHGHDHHHHGEDEVCIECGHAHMPDPKTLSGDFHFREAWGAVMAVGLRPCTGALVVLTFSFLNGLYSAGIASAFAMAFGTAITVASIASIAVGAKNMALRFAGAQEASAGFRRGVEIAGALCILLLGLTLLSATLTA